MLTETSPERKTGTRVLVGKCYCGAVRYRVEDAFVYARERCGDSTGRDGERLIDRALGTATIVAGLKLDAASIRAALLCGLPAAHAFDARGANLEPAIAHDEWHGSDDEPVAVPLENRAPANAATVDGLQHAVGPA